MSDIQKGFDNDEIKEPIINSFIRVIEEKSNDYQNNTELRANIQNIPILGPIIDIFFLDFNQYFEKQRFLKMCDMLHEEINLIKEDMVDTNFLNSEEFYDLFKRTFYNIVNTRHEEKIRLFCRILIKSTLNENSFERKSIESYLIILNDLSTDDIIVGNEIYKYQKKKIDKKINLREVEFLNDLEKFYSVIRDTLNISQIDFEFCLIKLSKAGLLYQLYNSADDLYNNTYIITNIFIKLVDLVKYSEEPLFYYSINKFLEKRRQEI